MQDYEEFVEKFKHKKTTDDCYTPPAIYEAVANFVADEYKLNRDDFVRPFYPGGDYENFDYTDKIVVDNPPFSILSQIVKNYVKWGVKFFLFCPPLTSNRISDLATLIMADTELTYENGARVKTGFITNLDDENVRIRTAPKLRNALLNAKTDKSKPKYNYPKNIIRISDVSKIADTDFKIYRNECIRIRQLESQKKYKKAIYGTGYVVSDRVYNALPIQHNESYLTFELSESEKELVKQCNANTTQPKQSED